MSAAPKKTVDPVTRARQALASDPATSAWVTANAGSGKTHVLTQRVIRLLLDGVEPSKILCLTFTKAAAANMSTRVFRTLAGWTTLDDAALTARLVDTGVEKIEAGLLDRARKLFARTIETPGGLKIQTIHAFCERLLHLFPFEANAPAGFRVLDDMEAAELLETARAQAIAEGETRPKFADAIRTLAHTAGADGFDVLLAEALATRAEIEAYGDPAAYRERLRRRLGLVPDETLAAIEAEMVSGGGGPAQWRAWAERLREGANETKRAAKLREAARAADPTEQLKLLKGVLFTENGAGPPAQQLTTKKTRETYPDLDDEMRAEQDRLERLEDRRRSALALERSVALVTVASRALAAYQKLKNARGSFDYADLIERALALVERADAAWVLYKLDRGISHFLVDEAQDTSLAQWQILQRLSEEFLSGEGAGAKGRTFFAVGDEKQSIFSFQGARPALFEDMKRSFAGKHERANLAFASVPLHLSFRSSPKVLEAVDLVFSQEQAWRGVSAGEATAPPHGAFHDDMPGSVEIWETIKPEPVADPDGWSLPLDAQHAQDPPVKLAERIADLIASWLVPRSAERLTDPASGALRRIRASDILILVRSRGAFYEAMTRALRRRRLDFAGADRLKLKDHMAVLDLVSAGRAALYPDDDLALAEVLKSPLLGLTDDDLIALAPGRTGSLAQALAASEHKPAAERLGLWRSRARTLSPFDFYARLLGADGGRRALMARLGVEAADAIDEFLALAMAFEADRSPSLSAFLDEVSESEADIKREAEAEGAGVRVMTVHAAKGLEAPIVFLPDTLGGGRPHASRQPHWLLFPGEPPLRVWATSQAEDSPPITEARNAAAEIAEGEHRRLLYVAMTRAAQRLIVAGFETSREPPADGWHRLIRSGLEPVLTPAPAPWSAEEQVWRFADPPPQGETATAAALYLSPAAPKWLFTPAAVEAIPPRFAPSRLGARPVVAGEAARLEGEVVHALIEKLAALPASERPAAAEAGLASLDEARRATFAARLLSLFSDPELADLFGPGSRAEVAISGVLPRENGPPLVYSGRIDRLAVLPDRVEIADFKSGSKARRAEHVGQLALYVAALRPLYDRPIRASIVWLEGGARERIAGDEIDAALSHLALTMRAAP